MKLRWLPALGLLFLISANFETTAAQQTKRPFTVADEIGLTLLGDPMGGPGEVHFSPDGNYFAVWSERGLLRSNQVEDSLRFYRSSEITRFLGRPDELEPAPLWVVNRSDKEGRIICDWRWLGDSSGIVFLEGHGQFSDKRLMLADLRKRVIEPLTAEGEAIEYFDISDRLHYVYAVADRTERRKMQAERQGPGVIGTGHPLVELLFPDSPRAIRSMSRHSRLWAVVGKRRFEVKAHGVPLIPSGALVLSPDGESLITKVEVPKPPESWGTLYPPSFASSPYRIRPGKPAHQYIRLSLETGSMQSLTEAPVSEDAGWWAGTMGGARASWSSDGKAVLLPGTFVKSKDGKPSRPCVAAVDLSTGSQTCVEVLKGRVETGDLEEGYHVIKSASFTGEDEQQVTVTFHLAYDFSSPGTSEYRRRSDGSWEFIEQSRRKHNPGREGLEVRVEQRFDKPPLLVATGKNSSRVIWDPNPQLKNLDLAQATLYRWKIKEGRELKGGLYMPSGYKPGQRYPLVIQTHGFLESEFRPSGLFPAAFAAEALAAAGIVVLQVQEEDCPLEAPDCNCPEGPCDASEYTAAANQLVSEGVVDPNRIGVIGFSLTCFYVMDALTANDLHFKAASITDGLIVAYSQYMMQEPDFSDQGNGYFGAAPFGKGLLRWFERSPGFNLDKVNTPLLVVGEGPISLLFMWEPYAGLHYLHKPVDLIMLNTDEHVLTNPAARMASQGGSVDWFRFWLQDYEDPDPAKKEQYERWRGLKKMQEENERKAAEGKSTKATLPVS